MRNVLITGVSGGMGLSTAKRYLSYGHKVYGLDIKEINEELGDNFTFIKTDLTSINDVINAYSIISKEIKHIDYIITLSGIYNLDSLVEISEEQFIKIFDINVFSIYRVNKVFLPLLDKTSKIIMISSELGPLDPLPFTGLYGITKSTLEKYAYSLRMELQVFGIKVIIVRPGAVKTTLLDDSMKSINRFVDNTKLYKTNAKKFKKITESVENKNISPDKVSYLIYKISQKKRVRYVYNINRNFLLRLLNILPQRLQNRIIYKVIK